MILVVRLLLFLRRDKCGSHAKSDENIGLPRRRVGVPL
jgi:hypothetical protein